MRILNLPIIHQICNSAHAAPTNHPISLYKQSKVAQCRKSPCFKHSIFSPKKLVLSEFSKLWTFRHVHVSIGQSLDLTCILPSLINDNFDSSTIFGVPIKPSQTNKWQQQQCQWKSVQKKFDAKYHITSKSCRLHLMNITCPTTCLPKKLDSNEIIKFPFKLRARFYF